MKRRIGILSVVNSFAYGGDEHRMLSFARHIDRRRFDHRIAVIKSPDAGIDSLYGSLRQEYESARIPLIDLGVKRPGNGLGRNVLHRFPRSAIGFATAINRLARLVREHDIDIVDGHIGTGNQAAVAVGRLTGRPASITTYHGEFFEPRPLWHIVQQITLRGANVIITDSEQRAEAMRTFLRRRRQLITIIPNGVAAEPPRRPAHEVSAELGIPNEPGRVVIGQIAGMIPIKGWTTLLEAATLVLARDPKAFFVCVGQSRSDPAFGTALRESAERQGVANRVRILSYPGHNADVWQLFDIHVHASHFDSLPNAIIEGMAYGKPAVVTDVGDCARTVIDGVSGFVVPPRDARALTDALLRLLSDPGLRERFGREARNRYLARHRPERMTAALEALFERMAHKPMARV
ncbi:MAG TPA: glycosyltransferase family 4 protein [Candidatus Tumulicola sp.]